MYLLDFISVYKNSLESVFLTFPFSKDSRKLYNFYDFNGNDVRRYEVIGIEIINNTVIISLHYTSSNY